MDDHEQIEPELPQRIKPQWKARQEAYQRDQERLSRSSSDDTQERFIQSFPGLARRRL